MKCKIVSLMLVLCLAAAMLCNAYAAEKASFTDVSESDWFYRGVEDAMSLGFMEGDKGSFYPYHPLTRAQVAMILYRWGGGSADGSQTTPYTDVVPGSWYADAVCWLTEEKIAEGYGDGTFRPAQAITREQFLVLLYHCSRRAGLEGINNGEAAGFMDYGSVHDYAKEAMDWAVSAGIIRGTVNNGAWLYPTQAITRAEAAVGLSRWAALRTE